MPERPFTETERFHTPAVDAEDVDEDECDDFAEQANEAVSGSVKRSERRIGALRMPPPAQRTCHPAEPAPRRLLQLSRDRRATL
jgi:hypothetical protein